MEMNRADTLSVLRGTVAQVSCTTNIQVHGLVFGDRFGNGGYEAGYEAGC